MYGAKKVTSYLGKYLTDEYSFDNKKDNEIYSDWNKACKSYKKYVKGKKIYIEPGNKDNEVKEDDESVQN